jgi:hypothetical protein
MPSIVDQYLPQTSFDFTYEGTSACYPTTLGTAQQPLMSNLSRVIKIFIAVFSRRGISKRGTPYRGQRGYVQYKPAPSVQSASSVIQTKEAVKSVDLPENLLDSISAELFSAHRFLPPIPKIPYI